MAKKEDHFFFAQHFPSYVTQIRRHFHQHFQHYIYKHILRTKMFCKAFMFLKFVFGIFWRIEKCKMSVKLTTASKTLKSKSKFKKQKNINVTF